VLPRALSLKRGDCIAAMLAGHGPPVWCCPIVGGLSIRCSTVELQEVFKKWLR
jgi:hypothetical protein